jgi:para-aminobenzoate synthetase / 4-amino-4-deoxychorismate lyase
VTSVGLFETIRVERGVALRLEAHLGRLARSAAHFGLPFDPRSARHEVERTAHRPPAAPLLRLRLDLDATGLRARAQAFAEPAAPAPVRVALAVGRVAADDPHQRHKTVLRGRYDRASAWARTRSLADVLFLNTRGAVAEGAISTVFVRRAGLLLTPPVDDGALPGVLRAELLATGAACERSLTREALSGELYLGSALRGLRRAVLATALELPQDDLPHDDLPHDDLPHDDLP